MCVQVQDFKLEVVIFGFNSAGLGRKVAAMAAFALSVCGQSGLDCDPV